MNTDNEITVKLSGRAVGVAVKNYMKDQAGDQIKAMIAREMEKHGTRALEKLVLQYLPQVAKT